VQRWTREAGLPPGKSFANLKLEEFSASEQQLIIAQKDHSDWVHYAGNVLLIGPSGSNSEHSSNIDKSISCRVLEFHFSGCFNE